MHGVSAGNILKISELLFNFFKILDVAHINSAGFLSQRVPHVKQNQW